MSTVFTSSVASALKETLDEIIHDSTDNYKSRMHYNKWMSVGSMDDNYVDDLETGGPGLVSEKKEGAELETGTLREGTLTRYTARTFGLKLIVTEEALEDRKYPKVIDAARRLKRALYKTIDIDATAILTRAENSTYLGGDNLPLASSAHTLPTGGTFSNTMATPMSPSRAAVIIARSAMMKYPGHDGVIDGVDAVKVVCPTEQWAVWKQLTDSTTAPEPNQFGTINVVNRMGLEVEPIRYWTNTTTNWGLVSDVDNGFKFKFRRKPRSQTWIDHDQGLMKYSIDARWSRGWSDPRCIFFVGA